jgi:S-adenosylmethionine hydrolase
MKPIVTLLTDFGLSDAYVGVMKGVILGINPDCALVDVTHRISAHNVKEATFVLKNAYPYFPEGTIHVAVVDPGVGTSRRAIGVRAEGRLFVGPDNGLLSPVLAPGKVEHVVELTEGTYFLPHISSTFHGRDIFAPAAAHLSLGVSLERMGSTISDYVMLGEGEVTRREGELTGEVVYVDRFGNLVTNISDKDFFAWLRSRPFRLVMAGRTLTRLSRCYEEGNPGEVFALFGSFGWLEFSIREGSAQEFLGVGVGAPVKVVALPS